MRIGSKGTSRALLITSTFPVMDSMWGMSLPEIERWSSRTVVVRGLNPGPMTGPGTNTYLLGTGTRPLLLDTGIGKPGYVPLLEQALAEECGTHAPGDLIITHVHPDHIGGAADVLRRFGSRQVAKLPWPGKDEHYELELTPLANGSEIKTQGATLRAVHTPGHARDHLCFYLEEERALFTGDLVLGAGTTVIPQDGGDMALYLESLEQLLELDLDRIYPGHGPMIENPRAKIEAYLQHRRERETQIEQAIRAGGTSVEKIVQTVYRDTPSILHPAAAQSVLSHLLKLERERRAARSLDDSGEEHWGLA